MMRPHFNSLPNNQNQANGTSSAAPPQQVMLYNDFRGNSSNSMPNSAQFKPQMGVINNNPQIANPFNNYNIHPNRPPFFMNNAPNGGPSPPPSCLMMNGPNGQFPLQNGMSPMALPQFLNGFGLQNISSMPMNQINTSQPNTQLFAHNNNSMNMAPYINQNVGFPNGQVCLQGPMQNQMQHMQNPMQNQMQNPVQSQMQNMGQFVQMQMPNYTQVVQGNMPMFQSQVSQGMAPHNGTFVMQPSQVSQSIGPQSATFVMKPPFGPANSNGVVPHGNQKQHRLIPPNAEANGPNAAQQLQGSSSHSGQPQQTQNFGSGFVKSQGNPGKENGVNVPNTNWKNSPNRNFTRHTKSDASHKGSMNSQFNHTQNANGKFRFHNERRGKANNNGARKSGLTASSNQTQVEKKRSLPLNYTEQEIQQWREDRKKNYPSKDNVDKKLTKREIADAEAMSRRQQVKEILAKQAELGCEVAEIPTHYLSDSEKQVGGKEDDNKQAFGKKGRQQNNFNKRGRFNKNNRFTKKQGPTDHDASNANDQNRSSNKKQRSGNSNFSSLNCKREPTLLQKLLGTDVRRDKAHLLQVFRFMVMNSYFKDWHEKQPLRFPNVVVKEGCLVEEKVVSEGSGKVVIEEVNGNDETEPLVSKEIGGFTSGSIIEEEEGEIID